MKTIKYSLIAFLLVLQVACIDKKFEDQFEITLDTDLFKQVASIQIFDPTNQSNLEGDSALKIEVLGPDQELIVTDAGEHRKNLKIVDGVVNFAVNPNKNKSQEEVNIVLRLTGDDYLTTTIPVRINENERVEQSAFVVNKTAPVDGIEREEETVSIASGMTTSIIELATSKTGSTSTNTRIKLDKSTELQDANGNPIVGNDLKLEVTHFSDSNVDALSSFPGGFSPQQVKGVDGVVSEEISFITAGFTSINMSVNGTEVKNFSKPITVTMSVNSDAINPDLGRKIEAGDIIPIWSYSKDDGQWDYHGEGTVVEVQGNLEVQYTTTHLSWYNLDFWTARNCSRYRGDNVSTLKINLPGITVNNSYRLYSDFVYEGGSQGVSYNSGKSFNWYDGQVFELNNAPAGRKLQMVVYSGSSRYSRGEEIYRSPAFDPCSGGIVNIDASSMIAKLPEPPVSIHVKYSGNCNGKIIRPSTYLYMYNDTYNYWQYKGYIYRGEITLQNMELNKDYQFRVYYNGKRFEHTLSFDKTEYINGNYEIPAELCNKL